MTAEGEKDPTAVDQNGAAAGDEAAPAASNNEDKSATRVDRVVGVVFADGKVDDFDPHGLKLSIGDPVLVDNARDLNLGRVVFIADRPRRRLLQRVIRRVGSGDLMLIRRNKKREEEALQICSKMIEQLGLPMKLIQVAYLHGGNKAILYFSADGRVDFRNLVRDLAKQLHVRIEMRQIGVRDESKMLGGIGICGQQLCCSRFLRKFSPVSIKMAKNQNLALNPQKLSGLCGRLMCCLLYEDKVYREQRKLLPRVGKDIETPVGSGRVIDLDIPGCRVRVQLEDRQVVFSLAELKGDEPYTEDKPLVGQNREHRGREARQQTKDRVKNRTPRSAPVDEAAVGKKPRPEAGERRAAEGETAPEKKKPKRRSRSRSRRRKNKTRSQAGLKPDTAGKGNGSGAGGRPTPPNGNKR
ncbi:MAG TPA: regulatory iron-sulfur-containing complex subunit RicT [Myxococcota bacterium]|nr:regulatory iron-sulfur-containing complex subunit RicT [Myxococcota bacterium]